MLINSVNALLVKYQYGPFYILIRKISKLLLNKRSASITNFVVKMCAKPPKSQLECFIFYFSFVIRY